ncbi:MAG TPA: sugar nucleotide-binding protein [Planctomycetaceae bacterium]|nr:sugar nucleotide-binding protein [Planctomycetaceae bacterium]
MAGTGLLHATQGGTRVETILVAGVDTMVGANISISLAGLQPVVGIALKSEAAAPGLVEETCRSTSPEVIRRLVDRVAPDRIIYCGPGANCSWGNGTPQEADFVQANAWFTALADHPAPLTLISSDAVFTGPWMFHSENSESLCPSREAGLLRDVESSAMAHRNDALTIRTHAFGWSPQNNGWLEQVLESLEEQQPLSLDCVRHASPILATDLLAVLLKAWQSGLTGTYHIAGAERVNPVQFARRLAHEFALPFATMSQSESLTDRATGYGRGETSLQTRKVRRALGMGLPLFSEGMERLYRQHLDGYRSRLQAEETVPRRVA